jgi:transcriptional antiterminator RfaH
LNGLQVSHTLKCFGHRWPNAFIHFVFLSLRLRYGRAKFSDKLFYSESGMSLALFVTDRRKKSMSELRRDWYVVYSKPRKEEQVQLHLGMKGIESFFPRLQLPSNGPVKRPVTALFPNYLFVRLDLAAEAHYVIWSPGVKRIVSCSDAPIPLDETVVQFLRERADPAGLIRARSQLSIGQQVEISGGPFHGFIGIIENPPNAQGRVRVLLKLLSRQISVKLGVEFIREQPVAIASAAPSSSGRVEVYSSAS